MEKLSSAVAEANLPAPGIRLLRVGFAVAVGYPSVPRVAAAIRKEKREEEACFLGD